MTPLYIVVSYDYRNNLSQIQGTWISTQTEALRIAKEFTKKTGLMHYALETIAKVELPVPQPIVTMKGD